MSQVAILGCGPAGLFAAHAVAQAGDTPIIFSKNRKSFMRGAQYLHQPIPGLSGEPFTIDYRLEGSIEGYRAKVYGDMEDVQVSPESLTGIADAWDIREAYDAAWDLYNGQIMDTELSDPQTIWRIIDKYGDVISSVSAKVLCKRPALHRFRSQQVWVTDFVKRLGAFADDTADNLVVCSGHEDDWWYRASRIHGQENTEFPIDIDMARLGAKSGIWRVEKPVDTTCDCWPEIDRVGRYGSWKKGVLSHEAFYEIAETYK
jgi:hypothetical protein